MQQGRIQDFRKEVRGDTKMSTYTLKSDFFFYRAFSEMHSRALETLAPATLLWHSTNLLEYYGRLECIIENALMVRSCATVLTV